MFWNKKEIRNSEDPNTPVTQDNFMDFFGLGSTSAAGVSVTIEKALGVPVVWAAVNFLSGTIAGLPLNVYKRTKDGRVKVKNKMHSILHDFPNDEMSSFEWRKYIFERVFTGGRGLSFIDRNESGVITDLWPLNPEYMRIKSVNGKKEYHYSVPEKPKKKYKPSEIIDIPFMLKPDGIGAYSPIAANKDAIGLTIAATNYGSKFFNDGGVVPFTVSGPFQTNAAMSRASDDLSKAVKTANTLKRLFLPLPKDHEVKQLGTDPDKAQLVELKKYCNEEIARIYSLPVVFIQDLSKGTFSNTEQQDLHLVKHTIKRWVEQLEQELNLKLFGRSNKTYFVEFNLDGLLRGDFKTRMDGYSTAIQNALMTPNEARRKENLADDPSGDKLMIQGATVPVENQLNLDLSGDENEA